MRCTFHPGRAALLAALSLLFAAASVQAATPRLLVWINGDKAYGGLQQVGDAFTRETGVPVVVQHPEAAPEKFQQAAAAAKGPDIMCWAHDRAGEWAKAGLIVPVTPGKAIRADIDDAAWQAFTFGGHTWAYPLAIEAVGLIYNRALVKTPPTTFDEVMALDKQLAAKGKKAILWDYNNSFFSFPLLAGEGGYVFGRDSKGQFDPRQVGVNTAGAVAAATVLQRLTTEGYMPRGVKYSQMETAFSRGDTAMMINGPWAWENARRAGIDFGVAAIPSAGSHPAKPFVGVLGCMIAAPSRYKDIAKEFLEQHVLKVDSLRILNNNVPLGTPASKAFYAELSADPNIRATMANARAGVAVPNIPETSRFWAAMDAALEAITNGRQAPKDALDGAAARIVVAR